MEPLSVSSLIISVIVGVAFLISKLHIKHCQMGCCDSDCRSPKNSPANSENDFRIEDVITTLAASTLNLNHLEHKEKKETTI